MMRVQESTDGGMRRPVIGLRLQPAGWPLAPAEELGKIQIFSGGRTFYIQIEKFTCPRSRPYPTCGKQS